MRMWFSDLLSDLKWSLRRFARFRPTPPVARTIPYVRGTDRLAAEDPAEYGRLKPGDLEYVIGEYRLPLLGKVAETRQRIGAREVVRAC